MRMQVETPTEVVVRQVRDGDSANLIELIGGCYAEYPGCHLVVREEPWLLAPATAYARWRGRLWVAERDGKVVASGGLRPSGPGMAGVHNLYVARSERRRNAGHVSVPRPDRLRSTARGDGAHRGCVTDVPGLATRLLELIEAEALARGARWTHLWSDTRFVQAHELYARLGYVRSGGFRERQDLSHSVEYHFVKLLAAPPGRRAV